MKKTILIIGATSGFGEEYAWLFADEGEGLILQNHYHISSTTHQIKVDSRRESK